MGEESSAMTLLRRNVQVNSDDGVRWGPIGREVYLRTYSRQKADGTNETWRDTVERVVDGNLALVDPRFHEPGEREKLFKMIYGMEALPAGRHLWSTGVHGRQFLANCHSAGFTRRDVTEHFRFTFDELMKGGGVGSNYSNKYISMHPPILSKVDLHIVCNPAHPDIGEFRELLSSSFTHHERDRYVVEDSREGWCGALAEVLRAAWDGRDFPLVIDVSVLRPKGALLRSFGGKSSGPAPLVRMLHKVAFIMSSRVGGKLSSLDVMEIDHEISRVVVAGGIRRSARMSVKHWADKDIFDFIHCKKDEDKHWTTNISVEVDYEFFRALRKNDRHATRVLREAAMAILKNGEPGFWNSSLASDGEVDPPFTPNPCGEIAMPMWDVCNLGHINLSAFAGRDDDAREAFRLMTRFLIRATFGDILNPHQREVVARNRRVGVGFFGYADWLAFQGVRFSESHHREDIRSKLRSFRESCRSEARAYARLLRIPEPIKTTCIAPTGTISNLPGVTSGCQPIFARYFKRRVRYSENDDNLKELIEMGYEVENSKYEPATKIVVFYCKDPLVARCETMGIDTDVIEEQSEISLSDHLAVQSMLQNEYADNAISYTINFNPKKVKLRDIEETLRVHLPHLKGTTLMPECSREQMPLERISKEVYEEAERRGFAKVSDAERECANGACPIK
jgi:ribonucleoside-triphosphate reductase